MKILTIFPVAILFGLSSASVNAETFFEITAGLGSFALDVDQKRGQQIEDDSNNANLSIGAYRMTSDKSAWGAVVDLDYPLGREPELPGSGKMTSLRVADYWYRLTEKTSFEVFAGFAQFDWKKKANGYFAGANYRYNLFGEGSGLLLEAKYYQDLAYDSPEGDDIVDGFNTSLKVYFQF